MLDLGRVFGAATWKVFVKFRSPDPRAPRGPEPPRLSPEGPGRRGDASGDRGCTDLAEANREQRVEERGGGDEHGVRPFAQHLAGPFDRRDAAHGENYPIPRSGLPPRQQLGDLPGRDRKGLSAADVGPFAADPLERRRSLVVEDAPADAVSEYEAVSPWGQPRGGLVEEPRSLERAQLGEDRHVDRRPRPVQDPRGERHVLVDHLELLHERVRYGQMYFDRVSPAVGGPRRALRVVRD